MIPFDAKGAFHPRSDGHQLRRLAVRGAAVTVSAAGLALMAQVISTAILARLMAPAFVKRKFFDAAGLRTAVKRNNA